MDCVYNDNNFLVWLDSKSKEKERERVDMMTFDLNRSKEADSNQ